MRAPVFKHGRQSTAVWRRRCRYFIWRSHVSSQGRVNAPHSQYSSLFPARHMWLTPGYQDSKIGSLLISDPFLRPWNDKATCVFLPSRLVGEGRPGKYYIIKQLSVSTLTAKRRRTPATLFFRFRPDLSGSVMGETASLNKVNVQKRTGFNPAWVLAVVVGQIGRRPLNTHWL